MSLASWLEAHFPVPADNADVQASDINRLEHSIRKWKGLLPVNLRKHDLFLKDGSLYHKEPKTEDDLPAYSAIISGDTCALCVKHFDSEGEDDEGGGVDSCFTCPLYRQGDGCETFGSPWSRAKRAGKINDMIEALEEALDRLKCEASDAAYTGKLLDGAETDEERNDILKQAHG